MSNLSRRLLPSTSALAAFESVARLGSFSAAADELALTQGAISRQISGLEEQLGILLFERSSRGVSLTESGRAYAKAIGAALSQIRTASLQAMTKRHGDTLNLAMLPTFGTRWLLPRIPRFVSAHPEITLNFATRIGIFDFEQDGLDVAIHIGQPNWPGAECTFLMDEMVAPVCSPEFLRENPINQADDLTTVPLLHMASRPGAWTHLFETLGVTAVPSPGMRFEQFSSVAQACSAGLGIALMPLFLIEAELSAGTLVQAYPQQVRSPSSYYLAAPITKMDFRPVALFRNWLIEEVGRWRNEPFYA